MTMPELSLVVPCHNEEQNLPNTIIYIRNLMLIRKRKFAFTAAASSQELRETG